jgi:hypothetical protein
VQTGKNLFDKTTITENSIIGHGTGVISTNNSYFVSDYIPVKSGVTYYFTGFNYWYQSYYDANKNLSESIPSNTAKATIPSGVCWLRVSGQNTNIDTAQLEVGESATAYEKGKAPTQYTASLGRTIYGGTADVVKGEGTETYTKVKLSDLTWTQGTAGGREYYNAVISTAETTNTHDIVTDLPYSGMVTVANMADKSIAKWQQSVRIYDTDISSVSQLLETYGNEYIAYPNRYATDFTFTPITPTPETALGVNNFWADEGDSEVTYRSDIDLYEAPSMLLGANNTETEGNEEQEGNE